MMMVYSESEPPSIVSDLVDERPVASAQPEVDRYTEADEVDIQKLMPSQIDTDLKLEQQQETTRSRLATFLIKILAGTVAASFAAILLLTMMSGFVDERRAGTFDKNTSLVKDLITFILTAQTGLIGTALGFYFGSRGGYD